MARPKGSIKLKITFTALTRISQELKPLLEGAFKKTVAKSGLWVGDFVYDGFTITFTLEYKINFGGITGVINSLKTTSSRATNAYLNSLPKKPQPKKRYEQEIPAGMMQMIVTKMPSDISDTIKSEFWELGYSYTSI